MNILSYVVLLTFILTTMLIANCLRDVEIVSKERIKNSDIIIFKDGTMFRKVEKY